MRFVVDSASTFQQALVIPAYAETEDFIARLLQLPCPEPTLAIIILNGPQSITENDVKLTISALQFAQTTLNDDYQHSGYLHRFQHNHLTLLFVDLINSRPDYWAGYGVGFARKLGMDICLQLFQAGALENPLVRSTDADVHWPPTYLAPLNPQEGVSAYIYPFRHGAVNQQDADHCQAAALYDSWLRYYVAGLKWSGSQWTFHTIGSTFAVHMQHYAIQRGFPKREAGEDFYLLNKLAKSGRIILLKEPTLILSNRVSKRTPFGTGKSIDSIINTSIQDWCFYHPDIFKQLKIWHLHMAQQFGLSDIQLPAEASAIDRTLKAIGVNAMLRHANQHSKDQATFSRHLHNSFDAAVTRKCIHYLRDQYYPSICFDELIQQAQQQEIPFISAATTLSTPASLSQVLADQERLPV